VALVYMTTMQIISSDAGLLDEMDINVGIGGCKTDVHFKVPGITPVGAVTTLTNTLKPRNCKPALGLKLNGNLLSALMPIGLTSDEVELDLTAVVKG